VRSPVTPDLIGKTCVVGLADGPVWARKSNRPGKGFTNCSRTPRNRFAAPPATWPPHENTWGPPRRKCGARPHANLTARRIGRYLPTQVPRHVSPVARHGRSERKRALRRGTKA